VELIAETVNTLAQRARAISDIVASVNEISDQTHLLALNASIEAARAGAHGQGFAVVAAEVRSLAQRSATAAKEIKSLIGDSVEMVDTGAKLVDRAGATMQEIVDSVKRVTDIIGEISAASDEQRAGIEQVSQAISQMDQVTQQNASLVEEAAAAAEAMQEQSKNLAQVVSVFRLDGMQTAVVAPFAREPVLRQVRKASPVQPQKKLAAKPRTQIPATPQPRRLAAMQPASGDEWEEF
jgi:methyl-accepting chemotaxis protein